VRGLPVLGGLHLTKDLTCTVPTCLYIANRTAGGDDASTCADYTWCEDALRAGRRLITIGFPGRTEDGKPTLANTLKARMDAQLVAQGAIVVHIGQICGRALNVGDSYDCHLAYHGECEFPEKTQLMSWMPNVAAQLQRLLDHWSPGVVVLGEQLSADTITKLYRDDFGLQDLPDTDPVHFAPLLQVSDTLTPTTNRPYLLGVPSLRFEFREKLYHIGLTRHHVARIAVAVHVGDTKKFRFKIVPLLVEMCKKLDCDVYLNYAQDFCDRFMPKRGQPYRPTAEDLGCRRVFAQTTPNIGMDPWGQIQNTFAMLQGDHSYNYILLLQTKTNPAMFQSMLDGFIVRHEECLEHLYERPFVHQVGNAQPTRQNPIGYAVRWLGMNATCLHTLCKDIGVESPWYVAGNAARRLARPSAPCQVFTRKMFAMAKTGRYPPLPMPKLFAFVAGTSFWMKAEPWLDFYRRHKYAIETCWVNRMPPGARNDYETPQYPHALERMFGYIAMLQHGRCVTASNITT
jgi:hypothetical protein